MPTDRARYATSLALPPSALARACHAWKMGGCLALSLWLGQYKPRFTVKDYGAAVQLVRQELGDDTDYSEGSVTMEHPDRIELAPGEYAIPEGADVEACRSCGADIVWTKTAAGKAVPLSLALVCERGGVRIAKTHFVDCRHSREWRRT